MIQTFVKGNSFESNFREIRDIPLSIAEKPAAANSRRIISKVLSSNASNSPIKFLVTIQNRVSVQFLS